jgi:hypothetical protein
VSLLGRDFFRLPERDSYPLAGLFLEAAIDKVGIEAVRDHLYPANAATWNDACRRAGTSAEELEKAFEGFPGD